ncbi:MAG: hypothetical protein HZB26_01115 [Candidatus Hydrogenedentes bacterium]|nr:hypothetical protein [Candidatus Hydrogenedentota bacterium]
MSRKPRSEVSGLTLMEEAFHLVRQSPFSVLALYYVGAIPFVFGLLYFTDNMGHRYANDTICAEAALGLAGLFIWMKCWQTVYSRRLLAEVRGEGAFPWTFRRICRMVTAQATLQPLGLVVLPLAFLAAIPSAWAYGLFQNITVLGDGEDDKLRTLTRRCSSLSAKWPRQSFFCIWILSPALIVLAAIFYGGIVPVLSAAAGEDMAFLLVPPSIIFGLFLALLCPFGILVAANIASALAAIPFLLRSLFGIETDFSIGGSNRPRPARTSELPCAGGVREYPRGPSPSSCSRSLRCAAAPAPKKAPPFRFRPRPRHRRPRCHRKRSTRPLPTYWSTAITLGGCPAKKSVALNTGFFTALSSRFATPWSIYSGR